MPANNAPEFLIHFKNLILALLLPPAPALMLCALGGWLLWRHRRTGFWLLGLALLLGWFGCTERFGEFLTEHLLHPPPPQELADLRQVLLKDPRPTAILVLGGGADGHVPEYGSSDLKEYSLARLRYGIWLSRQLDLPLGYSGGVGWTAEHTQPAEAVIATRIAAEEYERPLRWAESQSRDTRENARFSVPMLQHDGIHRIILVTQEMHLPRSLRDFAAVAPADLQIIPAGVGYHNTQFSVSDWLPSDHGLDRTRYALEEMLGLLAGH